MGKRTVVVLQDLSSGDVRLNAPASTIRSVFDGLWVPRDVAGVRCDSMRSMVRTDGRCVDVNVVVWPCFEGQAGLDGVVSLLGAPVLLVCSAPFSAVGELEVSKMIPDVWSGVFRRDSCGSGVFCLKVGVGSPRKKHRNFDVWLHSSFSGKESKVWRSVSAGVVDVVSGWLFAGC